ncbi:MAG: phospho-sugar mutase, partial [Clostridia bacterium]|nr:phospho-sugar mutase [Clostridia bacterium]
CASMLVCDAYAYYKSKGLGLYDVLNAIYEKYGYYMEKVKSYTLSGKEGMEKIASAMKRLVEEPLMEIGGEPVEVYEDHNTQTRLDVTSGEKTPTGLPKANALRYMLPGGAWIVVRPSGTEPKLKLYIGAVGNTEEAAQAQLDSLMSFMDGMLSELLK